MAASSEYELISRAVEFGLGHAKDIEADVVGQLERSGSTILVNALRTLTMHSTIMAIGSFSVFDALLQQGKGWKRPFAELDARLRASGREDLAVRFSDYRHAVNVLKHGAGPSYEKLLARRDLIEFRVKGEGERFFDEGDVAEGQRLVDADHAFVRQCSQVIEEVVEALRAIEGAG